MPVVPQYEQRVRIGGAPSARVTTQAPVEAFGGGQGAVPEGVAGVSRAVSGIGAQLAEVAAEERKKADQVQLTGADSSTIELQTQLQIEADQMKLGSAFGAPDMVRQKWTEGVQKIRETLGTDEQKLRFDVMQSQRYADLNRHVTLHAATQAQELDKVNTKAWFENSRNSVNLNAFDDQAISKEIAQQEFMFDEFAARNGLPKDSEAYKAEKTREISATHIAVLEGRLNSDTPNSYEAADAYLKANEAQMSERDRERAMGMLDRASTAELGRSVFRQTESMRLPDGNFDERKMRATVDALPYSTEKKDRIWSQVKALAGEATMNKNREDSAAYRSFMNNVIRARKQGDSLESALKLAEQSATDPYEAATMTEAVRKIYGPPTASDPQEYIRLWERVQAGTASKQELDRAYLNDGKISADDWQNLRQDHYKVQIEGKSFDVKATWDRIDILAAENIPDKEKREQYIYDLKLSGRGKSSEELWKMANDKIKGAAGTGWFGSNFRAQPQWKIDVQRRDAQNIAWGKAYEDIGKNEVNAIGKGILYQGKDTWGLSDVEGFAQEFGGYNEIRPGTPVHNAIKSLSDKNQLVTPSNVRAVLDKFPDGRY